MSARLTPRKQVPKSEDVAFALGSVRRWKIFLELGKGEPLPVAEIARRTGLTPNAASKVLIRLHAAGMLERGFGHLYRISAQLIAADGQGIDFGPILLRLAAPAAR